MGRGNGSSNLKGLMTRSSSKADESDVSKEIVKNIDKVVAKDGGFNDLRKIDKKLDYRTNKWLKAEALEDEALLTFDKYFEVFRAKNDILPLNKAESRLLNSCLMNFTFLNEQRDRQSNQSKRDWLDDFQSRSSDFYIRSICCF